MVLGSYLTTYGLPLMFAALAIGVAAAIQAERLVHTMLGKS
jgi:hypothetical protein